MNIIQNGFLLFVCFLQVTLGKKGFGPGEQEWGYVNVRPGAYMFWWLFFTTSEKTIEDAYKKPLILWIQGGPGTSSSGIGNFQQFGPVDRHLNPRNYSWVKDYNLLLVDNPIGTGFSFLQETDEQNFAKDNIDITKDLIVFLENFLQRFNKFQQVPFYVIGQSYGGKMASEFVLSLHKKIENREINCNLKGLVLLASAISLKDIIQSWGDILINSGLIDDQDFSKIEKSKNECVYLYDNEKYREFMHCLDDLESLIQNLTCGVNVYNYLKPVKVEGGCKNFTSEEIESMAISLKEDNLINLKIPELLFDSDNFLNEDDKSFAEFMNRDVKPILNIPDFVEWGSQSNHVITNLFFDFAKPVIHIVSEILTKTKLKVYVVNGQLDLIVNTIGTYNWVKRLNFPLFTTWYEMSPRQPLIIENILEGYVKRIDNFAFYWVNRGGHTIPADNPKAMEQILKDLIDE